MVIVLGPGHRIKEVWVGGALRLRLACRVISSDHQAENTLWSEPEGNPVSERDKTFSLVHAAGREGNSGRWGTQVPNVTSSLQIGP